MSFDTDWRFVIASPVVTVLSSSEERIGFEDAIEDDQEFSHGGGEGELGRFAGGAEALIKLGQDGVVACGH